jgi:hypothetical protein
MLAATALGGAIAAPPEAQGAPVVRPTQELATLLASHAVVSAPHFRPSKIGTVPAWRPITGGPTVLPVVGRTRTSDGVQWLRVLVPGRPNGLRGWITRRATVLSKTGWHIVVRTSSRRVRVFRSGRLVRSVAAIVGKPSTPTPNGRFFVEESVRMNPGAAGGRSPWR